MILISLLLKEETHAKNKASRENLKTLLLDQDLTQHGTLLMMN